MTAKDVNINIRSCSINTLVEQLQKEEILIKGNIYWSKQKQSRFIESLLLKVPITNLYLDTSNPATQVPIDGFERLNTLKDFMCGDMVLESLEFLTELEGLSYIRLSGADKRVLNDTILVVHMIEAQTLLDFRKALVRRINPSRLYRWMKYMEEKNDNN